MKELVGKECFQILDNKEYILFYFGASWCKPCQEILPSMEDMIREYDPKMIQFYKIDIDNKVQLSLLKNFQFLSMRRESIIFYFFIKKHYR